MILSFALVVFTKAVQDLVTQVQRHPVLPIGFEYPNVKESKISLVLPFRVIKFIDESINDCHKTDRY